MKEEIGQAFFVKMICQEGSGDAPGEDMFVCCCLRCWRYCIDSVFDVNLDAIWLVISNETLAENVVGEGGYGIVYRGVIVDKTQDAAKNSLNNRNLKMKLKELVEVVTDLCLHKSTNGLKGNVNPMYVSVQQSLVGQNEDLVIVDGLCVDRGQAEKDFEDEVETIGRVGQ
ncbi:hypothetical protein E3N88_18652 [Mikania micrantha]|uniref:non-specific serine/threonine protein kinase n=1 Tax=Mikania micrantha TaxID=192012 RepID=A0A5N6NL19_9ASTR|nr:hypothetical protein E3N88_18652 [Mikania micrantha]